MAGRVEKFDCWLCDRPTLKVKPNSLTGTGSWGSKTVCERRGGCPLVCSVVVAIDCMLDVWKVCRVGVWGEENTAAS